MNIRGYRLEFYQDPDDESWVAEVPDLPGCLAAGDTPNDAIALVEDAIESWIEAAEADGRPVPAPSIVEDEYSGRFLQRLPKGLHRRLVVQARREGVSLNSYCQTALAISVGMAEVTRVFEAAVTSPKPRAKKTAVAPQIIINTGPRNASTDPATGLRYYSWLGRRLPSVTSIRRLAGIPFGLHNWAISKVVDRVVDEWRDISAELAKADPAAVQVVRHRLRAAATDERDAAAAKGTAVHDAAATGKALGDVAPDVAPRLRQYLDWLLVSGAEVLASEFQCWNLTVGYAGTADLLCRFPDGSIWVVDLKTGKGIYGEYALQLLAYLMAEFIGEDDTVDEAVTALLRQAKGVAVLHLADDHWEFVSLRADAETWTAFRGLLAFGLWMRDHEKRETFALGSRKGGDQ